MKPRVFSAVQPSGNLHIGNYLGALKNWVRMQYDYESFFGIVDQHAITIHQKPADLRQKIEEVAALFLAAGIDPQHTAIFVQSAVPAHVELAWVLTCVTPVGWLTRMTQFKAKSEGSVRLSKPERLDSGLMGRQDTFVDTPPTLALPTQPSVGAGLLMYPVLMAADILLYQASLVPVGEDQAQHLELTRDIAQRFNGLYGETFVMPQTGLPTVGARIMGLDDPTAKMSKSAPGSNHAIAILDPPARIKKIIGRATTDTRPAVDFADLGDGVKNLLGIFQAFTGWTDDQMRQHFTGMNYAGLKKAVTDSVVAGLEPIQKRYQEITADAGYVRRILAEGAARASSIADATVDTVKQRVGLYN